MSTKIFPHVPDLEPFAWPGGYSILYIAEDKKPYGCGSDVAVLCCKCASEERRTAHENHEHRTKTFTPFVHWEGPDEYCEGCNEPLPSEYGDPDADEEATT